METEADAKDFIPVMKLKLEGMNLDDALNGPDADPVLIPLQHFTQSQRNVDSTFPPMRTIFTILGCFVCGV
jgi:hypothetical protein